MRASAIFLLVAAVLATASASTTPGVRPLTDATFEGVTQAATGQTTGRW